MNAVQLITNLSNEARNVGASYMGSLISLSVSIDDEKPLTVNSVRNVILNNPNIPDEWAPEGLNMFSIYVKTANELKRTSLDSFVIPHHIASFDSSSFGGYEVQKLKHDSKDAMPAIHRIFFKEKLVSEDADVRNRDLDFPHSILVKLKRVAGSHETDKNGTSQFQIYMDNDKCPDELVYLYEPFLATLHKLFDERCDGVFTGRQARDLLMDVIINRVHSYSINKGLYFVDETKVTGVLALVDALNSLDDGINVVAAPVLKFPNSPALNSGFQSVQQNLGIAVVKELAQFKSNLELLRDKDSETRGTTWDERVADLRRIKLQVEQYRNKELISNDLIENLMDECKSIIMENRFKTK